MKFNLRLLLANFLLLTTAGCETLVTGAARTSGDWRFVQSVGGLALGEPRRDDRGHVLLPIKCDVSGTQVVTTRPTAANSALVCETPAVRIRGTAIFLTVRATLASHKNSESRCAPADLGPLSPGRYSVAYLDPDGRTHRLGNIALR